MNGTFALAIAFLAASYLCGSLPFGYFIAKMAKGRDFDIRDFGSNNIGFTNVLRVLGWQIAVPVFVADFLKGFGPVLLCLHALGPLWAAACLLMSVAGHAKSLYFFLLEGEFSGGKSVATLFGGVVALQPEIAGISFVVFLITLGITRYLSLGSLLGCLSAFVLSFVFRLGGFWEVIFGVALAAIVYTHRSNLDRLVHGTEARFSQKRGSSDVSGEVVVAFVIHPMDASDYGQSPLTAWLHQLLQQGVITERALRALVRKGPVLENGQITGIVTRQGIKVRVLIFSVPLLPSQIKDPANFTLVMGLLRSAAVQAQRRGARVIGLGALLSTIGNGGADLQKWVSQRGLRIVVDNGAAFTVATTLYMLHQAVSKPLAECVIANVGASGFIGSCIATCLKGKVAKQIGIVRDERKIARQGGDVFSAISTELNLVHEADVVVFNTSSASPIISPETVGVLRQNAVLLDVAVPPDVSDDVLHVRPDLTLLRCGLTRPPGTYTCTVDFHFGTAVVDGRTFRLLPACLSQTVILGITQAYEQASCGSMVRPANVQFFTEQAERMGFGIDSSSIAKPKFS